MGRQARQRSVEEMAYGDAQKAMLNRLMVKAQIEETMKYSYKPIINKSTSTSRLQLNSSTTSAYIDRIR